MSLITFSRLTTIALAGLGFMALHGFGERNTFIPQLTAHIEKGQLPMPTSWTGSTESIPESFTGVGPVDNLLKGVLVFFWPAVDGQNPGLSLFGFLFGGQGVAMWTITMLEGWRAGNSSSFIRL
jgi:hypothetical protein